MSLSDVFDWIVGACGFVFLVAVLVDFARRPPKSGADE